MNAAAGLSARSGIWFYGAIVMASGLRFTVDAGLTQVYASTDFPEKLLKQMRHSLFTKVLASSTLFLFAGIPMMAQGQRNGANQGAQQFATNCSGCHGGDGKGSDKAPAIATMQRVIDMSDAALTKVVHDGTAAGMPPFAQIGDANIAAVVRYLRTLQGVGVAAAPAAAAVTGDAAAGRALYFGKAQCSSCHEVAGVGGVLGPDMTGYALTHQPAAIKQSILTPGAAPAAGGARRGGGGGGGGGFGSAPSKSVELELKSGQKLTGVVRGEDNMGVALLTQDGRYHFIDRGTVAKETTLKTLMPADYSTKLSPGEIDDIVAYLVAAGKAAPVEPAAAPAAAGRRGGGGGGF